MSRITDKLDREIDEMERTMGDNPAPEKEEAAITDPSQTFDLSADEDESSEEITHTSEKEDDEEYDDEEEHSASKPKRVSWKKRYSTYKASSDATIYSLRQEIVRAAATTDELRKKVNSLQKLMSDKQPDSFTSAFSEEDMNIFGEDAVNSMKRATESMVAPLKQELAEAREKLRMREATDVQNHAVQAKTTFLNKLANAVPDYAEIDVDPKFAEWVNDIDMNSGFSRLQLFKNAEANGDVGRVASFMNEFKALHKKRNPLDSKITPTSSQQARETNVAPEQITPEYVNKFYDDYAKGKYRGKEKLAQEIETKIDKALMAL